jgi:hypothetical protein
MPKYRRDASQPIGLRRGVVSVMVPLRSFTQHQDVAGT